MEKITAINPSIETTNSFDIQFILIPSETTCFSFALIKSFFELIFMFHFFVRYFFNIVSLGWFIFVLLRFCFSEEKYISIIKLPKLMYAINKEIIKRYTLNIIIDGIILTSPNRANDIINNHLSYFHFIFDIPLYKFYSGLLSSLRKSLKYHAHD